jgi:aldose 1-epimerase
MYEIKKGMYFDSIFIESNDLKVEFIDYGATIKQIQTKNHLNKFQDVLLEFKNPEDYLNNSIYLNATIGPIAGRVKNGEIITNNNHYQLDKNQDNKHALHSSNLALSFKKFNYQVIENDHKTKVVFTYVESSFSDLKYIVTVTYTVIDNQIKIHYNVESETDFFFNLTNHAYFNLSGNLDDNINNHVVNIHTNKYHKLDEDLISTHQIQENRLYDFTSPKSLKEPLTRLKDHPNKGYDDIYYFLNSNKAIPKASVYDPKSKRRLEIYSTYDHMVFYTHNNVNNLPLKHISDHFKHYGLCFEFQKSPHGYKHKHASNTYLEQNHQYNEEIILKFTLKD